CQWVSQRIVDGLPIIRTVLEKGGQRAEIEQFAVSLTPGQNAERGHILSGFFTRVRISGKAGPVEFGFRLDSDSDDIRLKPIMVGDHWAIIDAATEDEWMTIKVPAGLTLNPEASEPSRTVKVGIEGMLEANATPEIEVRLASPKLAKERAGELTSMTYDTARAATIKYWEDWIAKGTFLEVPEPSVNDLARAAVWQALTLPRHRTEKGVDRIDLPYSNVAYGQYNADWPINQGVYVDYMIHGLKGYFDVAEAEFAAVNQTQMREGGRIGGFAEWGVYSPGHLYAIAQNYLLSHDRESFERLLPDALKTLDWILGQVAAANSEGGNGLIKAPLNDLTHSEEQWAFPNGYFAAGLDVFGQALAVHDHPRAAEVNAAAAKMKADIERAFARASVKSPIVRLRDNTWSNFVPTAADVPRRRLEEWYPTDVDCGPLHMSRLSALDPKGWLTTAMVNDHEDNMFFRNQGASDEPVYNQQASAYLMRDEPEAVIRSFYSMMAGAFSHGQLEPLEHLYAHGQYSGPPSTTGSWYEQLRRMIVGELDGALIVGQATPRAWLEDGKKIVVERAQTWSGPVDVTIGSAARQGTIGATIKFRSDRRPGKLLVRLRHPDKKPMKGVTVNGADWKDFDPAKEWVVIPEPNESSYQIVARY
ncbi:MAG: hypothetical protein ABI680_18390, partial [Chthoniobacteraceae bacterium]